MLICNPSHINHDQTLSHLLHSVGQVTPERGVPEVMLYYT